MRREGDSGTEMLTFTVTRRRASARPSRSRYATANGTATAGSDYAADLRHPDLRRRDNSSGTIAVTVLGDTTDEPNETFGVNLTSAPDATLADAQGTGRSRRRRPPELSIDDATRVARATRAPQRHLHGLALARCRPW